MKYLKKDNEMLLRRDRKKKKSFYSLECDNTLMFGMNYFQGGSKYLTKFTEYTLYICFNTARY